MGDKEEGKASLRRGDAPRLLPLNYMDEEIDGELLAKYFAGECSQEEKDLVHDWIARKPGATERMARLQQIWEAADRSSSSSSSWNAHDALERVQKRVREETASEASPDPSPRSRRSRDRRRRFDGSARSRRRRLWSTAALGLVFALAVLGALLTESGLFLQNGKSEPRVFRTEKGEQTTVYLSDSTKVKLNVDTRLTIPVGFEDRREARLEGEAYFDVVEDPTRPFTVHTSKASIQVLGTAFNARSYSDSKEMKVAVTRGKVALRTNYSQEHDTSVVLSNRSVASVSDGRQVYVRRNVDLLSERAWTKGILAFENAPFEEVVRKLERWYDIEVELLVPAEEVVPLNAAFEGVPLKEALHDIGAALNLNYKQEAKRVTFYR